MEEEGEDDGGRWEGGEGRGRGVENSLRYVMHIAFIFLVFFIYKGG